MRAFETYRLVLQNYSRVSSTRLNALDDRPDNVLLDLPFQHEIYGVTYRVTSDGPLVSFSLARLNSPAPFTMRPIVPSCVMLDENDDIAFWYRMSSCFIPFQQKTAGANCPDIIVSHGAERIRKAIHFEVISSWRAEQFSERVLFAL